MLFKLLFWAGLFIKATQPNIKCLKSETEIGLGPEWN